MEDTDRLIALLALAGLCINQEPASEIINEMDEQWRALPDDLKEKIMKQETEFEIQFFGDNHESTS